jgi:hypothetical protein
MVPTLPTILELNVINQGCTDPGHEVAHANKFCNVANNILGPSIWDRFHVPKNGAQNFDVASPKFCTTLS